MVADAILDLSNSGDIVLDPFGGSGTTLLAAHATGRCARLIELDPRYVDVTIRRWHEHTGEQAIELRSDQTFDALVKLRKHEAAQHQITNALPPDSIAAHNDIQPEKLHGSH